MKPIRRNVWTTLLAFFFLVGVSAIPLAEAGVTGPGPTGPAGPSGPAPSGTGPVGVVAGVATAPSSCATNSLITWGTSGPACTHLSAGVVTTDASGIASAEAQVTPAQGGAGIDLSACTNAIVTWGSAGVAACTTVTGTGAPVRATSPTLVTPALGAATGTSITVTGDLAASGSGSARAYVARAIAANTVGDAFVIDNSGTAATSGNQRYGGAIHSYASGFGTTGGAAQTLETRNYLVPVQGLTPTWTLTWDGQINGGGFGSPVMTLDNSGFLTLSNGLQANGGATIFKGSSGATSSFGLSLNKSSAATSGVPVEYSPYWQQVGYAWNSVSAASEQHVWRCENRPASAAGTTTSSYVCAESTNGGAYVDRFTISSGGTVTITGALNAASAIQGGTSGIGATSVSAVTGNNASPATAGTLVQYGGGIASNGAAWDTDDLVSRNVRFRCDTRPTSGTTVGGSFVCASSIDGAAYVDDFGLTTTGAVTAASFSASSGLIASGGNVTLSGSSTSINQTGNAKGTRSQRYVENAASTTLTPVTLCTIALATSNTTAAVTCTALGTDASINAYAYTLGASCKNVSGTVTCSQINAATALGASVTTNPPSITASGTNILLQTGDTSATSITWTGQCTTLGGSL